MGKWLCIAVVLALGGCGQAEPEITPTPMGTRVLEYWAPPGIHPHARARLEGVERTTHALRYEYPHGHRDGVLRVDLETARDGDTDYLWSASIVVERNPGCELSATTDGHTWSGSGDSPVMSLPLELHYACSTDRYQVDTRVTLDLLGDGTIADPLRPAPVVTAWVLRPTR